MSLMRLKVSQRQRKRVKWYWGVVLNGYHNEAKS